MSQALYRKWRPARFDEVVGQEHVTHTLQKAVALGRIGHAYLFSGPRGTGKTTTARLLAKAANCLAKELAQRPCNACQRCLAVNEGRYLDLIEIDAASNTGVDDIRDLREKINFSPSDGRYKVYIIDEVHMLSTAAFNALLKTLEEPPAHAMFILATTEEHKVPLTIKSRCQQFNFRLLTIQEIAGRLRWLAVQEHLTLEPEAVIMIAQHGTGSLRDAESLLDQLVMEPGDTITLERAQTILGTASDEAVTGLTEAWLEGDGPAGLVIIHRALTSGADPRQFARQMVAYLRQLLLLQTAGGELAMEITAEQQADMTRLAKRADRRALIAAVKGFNEAAMTSSGGWQPQLPLEMAFIELLPITGRAPRPAAAGPPVSERPAARPEQPAAAVEPPAAAKEQATPVKQEPPPERTLPPEQERPLEKVRPEPKPPAEAAPPAPAQAQLESEQLAAALSLSLVTANWPTLRERLDQHDRNLKALLASCKPLATEGNFLILGFDYPIIREKFERKPQAKETVAGVLSELVGRPCAIRTVVTDQYTIPAQPEKIDKAAFSALADELGGIVRETE
jgi:DNA polymerase III subunit gamma/tau